ncbi:unnamed protein product [Lactuca virosa]|uniref:Dolichol kinase n=1 Tax=Lactuca virosa TaxID=75947 RepID=A0AAU9LQC0_9ASTR|nr:unnamed protein product [Lactuca virosa]
MRWRFRLGRVIIHSVSSKFILMCNFFVAHYSNLAFQVHYSERLGLIIKRKKKANNAFKYWCSIKVQWIIHPSYYGKSFSFSCGSIQIFITNFINWLYIQDGSKVLVKGNACSDSHDSLLKGHKNQRDSSKKMPLESGRMPTTNKNILRLLHDFTNQFLLGGYNGNYCILNETICCYPWCHYSLLISPYVFSIVLMQSIREDIEKEHHVIENTDVVIFFQVAEFIMSFQNHKLLASCGICFTIFAPFVSEWVPFYYTSSMAIGVLVVVLILLYQARKLLPTGRRNAFYLGIMSTVDLFVVHSLSTFLNSLLQNFGLSQEVQNPVSVFMVLGIILLGAAFGYWLVRKYIISEDGEVDVGVAVTSIILSTKDTPLAMAAVGSCLGVYYMITKIVRKMPCRIYATLKELNVECIIPLEWTILE